MARIILEELKTGMTLNADAADRDGRVLLGAGAVLDAKSISILKKWGVLEVDVAETAADIETVPAEGLPQDILDLAESRMADVFRNNDLSSDPVRELHRLCVIREAKRLSEEAAQGLPLPEPGQPGPAPSPNGLQIREKSYDPYDIINRDIKLGTLPDIFNQLVEVVSDPRSSAADIGTVVSKDTGLSTRLLKIANSAYYGFPQRIDTITRAVLVIGSKQLSALALGVSVISMFRNIPQDLVSMRAFWEHSVACGICARLLAGYKNVGNTERLFVAGLLHDVGHLVIYKYLPEQSRDILLAARQTGLSLSRCEQAVLGFDHARIGGLLLKKWRLPSPLETAVWHHHAPQRSPGPSQDAALTCVANTMAYALGYGTSGEPCAPRLDPEVWKSLELSPAVFAPVIVQADRQVNEIVEPLFSHEIT